MSYGHSWPFVVQLLWDNVVYGVDDTGDSMTLYQRLRDLIVAADGRWPVGLPGPAIFSQVPGDIGVSYAWPRLPGQGQPLLVHTGPSTGTGSFIADPNFYSNRQPSLDEYRQFGWPNGISIAPWSHTDLPTVEEDAEMVDAGPSTSTSTSTAAIPVEPSAPGPSHAPSIVETPADTEDVDMEERKDGDVETSKSSTDKSDRAQGKQKDPNP